MNEKSVIKVFSVKDGRHKYYVQEMPVFYMSERRFAVMKNRRRLCNALFQNKDEAIRFLLRHLFGEHGTSELELQ